MYLTLGGDLSHKKMEHSYSEEMFIRRAKTSRIIGGPDNQRPDKWNPTVFTLIYLVAYSRRNMTSCIFTSRTRAVCIQPAVVMTVLIVQIILTE